jgi:hypothetical protein
MLWRQDTISTAATTGLILNKTFSGSELTFKDGMKQSVIQIPAPDWGM